MTLFPIIERELRVRARRKALRWPRVIMAAVALLILTWTVFVPQWAGVGLPPQAAVTLSFGLLFIVAAFMGARLTADSVSQEYRDQTIGLLLLSHLKGWEIAIGKLVSNTLTAAFTLMATVPMLSIPVLAGGAEAGQVFKLGLAMLNVLVLSAALGLFFSSRTTEGRRAQNFAMLFIAVSLFVLPGLLAFSLAQGPASPWRWLLLLRYVCPTFSIYGTFGALMGGGIGGGDFWKVLGVQQALAWLLVFAAGWSITRRSVDRPAGGMRLGWRQRWRLWRLGNPTTRARRRQRMLDCNPFEWLVCRYRWRNVWPLVLTGLPLAVFTAIAVIFPDEVEPVAMGGFAVLLMHALLKFQIASESVHPILTERREGTAELLLSTPLANEDLMRGQWGAIRSQFAPAVGLTLAATAGLAFLIFVDAGQNTDIPPEGAFLLILPAVALLADWWALTWVGMWCATWRGNARKAAGNTATFVLVLPWLGLFVGSMAFAALMAYLQPSSPPDLPFLLIAILAWSLLGFGGDLFWTLLTRRILRYRIRRMLEKPIEA